MNWVWQWKCSFRHLQRQLYLHGFAGAGAFCPSFVDRNRRKISSSEVKDVFVEKECKRNSSWPCTTNVLRKLRCPITFRPPCIINACWLVFYLIKNVRIESLIANPCLSSIWYTVAGKRHQRFSGYSRCKSNVSSYGLSLVACWFVSIYIGKEKSDTKA